MISYNNSVSTFTPHLHQSPAFVFTLEKRTAPGTNRSMYLFCSFIKKIFLFCSCFFQGQVRTNKKEISISMLAATILSIDYAIIIRSQEALVVAVDTLHAFMLFLRMQTE